ncbi:MAG: acetyl-CoA carboxylase, carboxyltransferase subunit beta [Candidatus Eisenbacteria bacterium]|nr:acetyl-CoA carboxylase, carboxyltransferase subunit beta [Candidatus Eisenbacteria bacterium]
MSWLKRETRGPRSQEKREVPEGLWVKCDSCGETIYARELERNLHVCPKCGHHFRINSRQYAELLLDGGHWTAFAEEIESTDPLGFVDSKPYLDRYAAAVRKTRMNDAVLTATGTLGGRPVVIAFMEFGFIGGSMGSVVGEKIARAIETAGEEKAPLLILSASGGARMMEGTLSLMQMAKTSALLAELREMGIPFISILTNPTTGGVTASFASLGDVILAEPKALIGFAGPRVIRETVNQELPPGFQRSEFLLEHGMIDMIVVRHELKPTIGRLLDFLSGVRSPGAPVMPTEPPTDNGG